MRASTGNRKTLPWLSFAGAILVILGISSQINIFPASNAQTVAPLQETNGKLIVHYIDVGQADCILIQQGTSAMLIDAGNNDDSDLVVAYLKAQNITKLDYVIGTHPHEDHIGGLDAVISTFDIGRIILPDVTNTTQTFEDVLLAIQAKGLKITKAVAGDNFKLGSASVYIDGPVLAAYDELNDYSVVCKITFGNTSFLFEGDAEVTAENAMLAKGFDLSANVLKVGHHGSSSSTGDAFLRAVNPQYAVISVGVDNSYGHPAADTLKKLQNAGISVFRTDLAGTLVATSDGDRITFKMDVKH